MARSFIDRLVWLPVSWFSPEQAAALRERLTAIPKLYDGFKTKLDSLSEEEAEEAEEEVSVEPIPQFIHDAENRLIGVPISFGLEYLHRCNKLHTLTERFAEGQPFTVPRLPDPLHERAAAGQARFTKQVLASVQQNDVSLVQADTGTGKTVVALSTIGTIGRTALVLVPSKQLVVQWVEEAKLHLGLKEEEIGTVMEGKAYYHGKKLVIALLHGVADNEWPDDFYQTFGFVVWDEAHRLGARTFSRSLTRFPARYKLAMTATPNRGDGCQKIFVDYFGEPKVKSTATALRTKCYILRYDRVKYGKAALPSNLGRGIILTRVAFDPFRNEMIAKKIIQLWEKGRNILVIGDRIRQLQILMALCLKQGIPEAEMGLYTNTYEEERIGTLPNGKEYSYVVKKPFKQEHLDLVKETASIIFSTYGQMKEGKNIPRLDAGIEATPRSEGTQMIGRIRRPLPGKPIPVWYTIRDVGVAKLTTALHRRLSDFRKCNVEITELRG